MPVGIVKWFDCKKGFGFVVDPSGADVFVHFSVIEGQGFRRLRDGEQVEYETMQGPKGLLASKVRRLSSDGSNDGQPPAPPTR
jgi:CspA family cold shock protein